MQPSNVNTQFCHVVTSDTIDVTESTMDPVYNVARHISARFEFIIAS